MAGVSAQLGGANSLDGRQRGALCPLALLVLPVYGIARRLTGPLAGLDVIGLASRMEARAARLTLQ